MTPHVITRPLRLPSRAQTCVLLAGGWVPAGRLGWWRDAAGDDRVLWWQRALELATADAARARAA